MDSENNYDIIPANNHCSKVSSVEILPQPGSKNETSLQSMNTGHNQQLANAQYDTVKEDVKPMYGGNNKFKIIFQGNISFIDSVNEITAMKKILNGKIYKKNHLIEIYNNNTKSLYVLRSNKKNKFKKLY